MMEITDDMIKPRTEQERKDDLEYVNQIALPLINKNISKKIRENENQNFSYNMPFGKYKGKEFKQVLIFDRKYLQWLYKQDYVKKFETLYNLMQDANL